MILSSAEWLMSWGDRESIKMLQARLSHRQERLFSVACCRQVLHLVPEEPCRLAVEAAEAYADGHLSDAKLRQARRAAQAFYRVRSDEHDAIRCSCSIPRVAKSAAADLRVWARCLAAGACDSAVSTRYQFRRLHGRLATSAAFHAAKVEKLYEALLVAPEEAFATSPDDLWEETAAEAAYRQA